MSVSKTAAEYRVEAERCNQQAEKAEAAEKDCGCDLKREVVKTVVKAGIGLAIGVPIFGI
jgi:hypothetical protein